MRTRRDVVLMIGLLSLLALVIAACGASPAAPAATPDSIATRVAEELAVAATLTAKAPQPTATPSAVAVTPTTPPPSAPASPTAPPPPTRANTAAPTVTSAQASPPPQLPTATPTRQPPTPTATRSLPTQTPTPRPNPVAIVVLPVDGSGDDNPNIRNGRNIKNGRNVILPGFAQNEVSSPMVFRDRIVFRVEAFDSAVGNTDGAGIQNVKFVITGPNGEVHSRPENTAGYCAFGGGEPNCDVWVFYQRGNKWPNGKTIENGPHSVTITITPKQGKPVQWFWTFEIKKSK